jgi:hypothetical protein
MARGKKRKGNKKKGTVSEVSDRHVDVQLAPTVEFIHQHLTEALCDEVFRDVRTTERQRKWSLYALSRFWLHVTLDPPPSLSHLLEQVRRGDMPGLLPEVCASAESFFQKCKNLSSGFPMALHYRFVDSIVPKAPKQYCQEVAHLQKEFSDVVAIDGSRLDKIAHRLKILWPEKAAILPGCLLAVYDLFRGFARQLWFDPNAAAAEFNRACVAIECLAPRTLVLGDRLYCSRQLFRLLAQNHCFGLFRRNKGLPLRKVRRLSRVRFAGGILEDCLVETGRGEETIQLRLVTLKKGGRTYEALTSVLDPQRLTAQDVVALYPLRWKVERLFYDLKVVLNLKKFYAGNPNAVAMQVYAAAMAHTAFRIAQAKIAKQVKLPPEELSSEKLFPHLALVSIRLIEGAWYIEELRKANPGVKLREPNWRRVREFIVSLRSIRVQRRSGNRRKREYDEERRRWKSITKVEGAEELS